MDETHQVITQMLAISIGLGGIGILTSVIGLFTMSWYMHRSLHALAEVLRERQ